MNLLRPQAPYRFVPPKYSPWFRPVLHFFTRLSLRYQHKIGEIKIIGQEALVRLVKERQTVMVTPNHADHADPGLMITVGRQNHLVFHFMAAREGFEQSPIGRFVLQRAGAFSVNREGGDLASIKTAIRILSEARFPLVIFPEGEIYHHKEELDELNDGVASMVLRASLKLPENRRSYVVPASIRLFHDESAADSFSERLSILEEQITWKPRINQEPIDRILRLGSALLSVKEEEFLGGARQGDLTARIQNLREILVGQIEELHGISNESLTIPKRIKAIRAIIRKELTDSDSRPSPEREEELYDQLDRVYAAHQLYSYHGVYLRENPSVDRIAETIFKLEEDVLGKARHLGIRRAEILFDLPIDVGKFLGENRLTRKSGVGPLTELIRTRIQALLKS